MTVALPPDGDGRPVAQPPFHDPAPVRPERQRYIEFREDFRTVLAEAKDAHPSLARDIANALLDEDFDLPGSAMSAVKAGLTLGRNVRKRRRYLTASTKAVDILLEQIFDPTLDCVMTEAEIRDAYQVGGLKRSEVTQDLIEAMYVQVETALKAGRLRQFIFEANIEAYVGDKLNDIRYSRLDWNLRR